MPPLVNNVPPRGSASKVVCGQGGLWARWSAGKVVCGQGGLRARRSAGKAVCGQGGLRARWSAGKVVCGQGGLRARWSAGKWSGIFIAKFRALSLAAGNMQVTNGGVRTFRARV